MQGMTLREFIDNFYNIDELVRARVDDPLKRIMEEDWLPCDGVRPVDGVLQKVIFLDDDEEECISVVELLSMDEVDAKNHINPDVYYIWKNYMADLEIEPFTMEMLVNSAKLFMKGHKERIEALLSVSDT